MILAILIALGLIGWITAVLRAAPAEQARADAQERLKSICGN